MKTFTHLNYTHNTESNRHNTFLASKDFLTTVNASSGNIEATWRIHKRYHFIYLYKVSNFSYKVWNFSTGGTHRKLDNFSDGLKQPFRDSERIFTRVVTDGDSELRETPDSFELVLNLCRSFLLLCSQLLPLGRVSPLPGSLRGAEDTVCLGTWIWEYWSWMRNSQLIADRWDEWRSEESLGERHNAQALCLFLFRRVIYPIVLKLNSLESGYYDWCPNRFVWSGSILIWFKVLILSFLFCFVYDTNLFLYEIKWSFYYSINI